VDVTARGQRPRRLLLRQRGLPPARPRWRRRPAGRAGAVQRRRRRRPAALGAEGLFRPL